MRGGLTATAGDGRSMKLQLDMRTTGDHVHETPENRLQNAFQRHGQFIADLPDALEAQVRADREQELQASQQAVAAKLLAFAQPLVAATKAGILPLPH